jgi:hypothetical protein
MQKYALKFCRGRQDRIPKLVSIHNPQEQETLVDRRKDGLIK